MKHTRTTLLFWAAVLAPVQIAFGGTLTSVSIRSSLSANDSIDWGQLGADQTDVTAPLSVHTFLGAADQVTDGSQVFSSIQQGNTWGGNFTAGDNVLFCCNFSGSPSGGPYTITFASPIRAAGAQFQSLDFGAFTATITAFGAGNTNFGSVTETGASNSNNDGSAIFLGVESSATDIVAIQLQVTIGASPDPFAINTLSINTGSVSGVPEPGSAFLAGIALAALVLTYRHKTRSKDPQQADGREVDVV